MVTTRPALTLFCAVALRGAVKDAVLPAFTRDTGTVVDAHFATTSTLVEEIDRRCTARRDHRHHRLAGRARRRGDY